MILFTVCPRWMVRECVEQHRFPTTVIAGHEGAVLCERDALERLAEVVTIMHEGMHLDLVVVAVSVMNEDIFFRDPPWFLLRAPIRLERITTVQNWDGTLTGENLELPTSK